MKNKQIRAFEDAVIDLFNASDLEPEIKRLVAQNVLDKITKVADSKILEEIREEREDELHLRENSICE